MSGNLDEQLKQRLANTGALSSADIAAAAAPVLETPQIDVNAPLTTKLDQKQIGDPIAKKTVDQPATQSVTMEAMAMDPMVPEDQGELDVTTTPDERDAFITAAVEGRRLMLPFSIFGGRLQGMLRSRTQAETRAIITQLQREVRNKDIVSDADYSLRLRGMLLAAQLAVYNGVENPALVAPLMTQRAPDGKEIAPAWLLQADSWQTRDEGLVAAVYEQLRLFEMKYWTMIRHAGDQNFWNPAPST